MIPLHPPKEINAFPDLTRASARGRLPMVGERSSSSSTLCARSGSPGQAFWEHWFPADVWHIRHVCLRLARLCRLQVAEEHLPMAMACR